MQALTEAQKQVLKLLEKEIAEVGGFIINIQWMGIGGQPHDEG